MPASAERRRHAIRRPRLLRTWLEHESDLHRDDRHPQRVHARRVRRQHETEHRALRLIADRHAALLALAGREHVERQAARQRLEDVAHLAEHERVLLHVRAAHALGQPGGRRLRVHELVGRLRAVAHRQRGVHVELAGLADPGDQVVDRDLAQRRRGRAAPCARRAESARRWRG